MLDFPDAPDPSADDWSSATMSLRYEDVSQDGRLTLETLTHGFGPALWAARIEPSAIVRPMLARGVVPILTRLVLEGGPGPIGVRAPVDLRATHRLAHTADASGEVDRLVMLAWLTATGRRGRTYGPPKPGDGEPVPLGRAFCEHVFTRLFAAPGDRKVTSFDGLPGLPLVPPDRYTWRDPALLLSLPDGAAPLEDAPAPDAPVAFGLDHTDSNQHVNSLVYPRLFFDAALRRFAALGRPTALIARRAEVAFRKPCFAGQRARVVLRAFSLGDDLGAAGAFVPDGGDDTRPFCTIRAIFGP